MYNEAWDGGCQGIKYGAMAGAITGGMVAGGTPFWLWAAVIGALIGFWAGMLGGGLYGVFRPLFPMPHRLAALEGTLYGGALAYYVMARMGGTPETPEQCLWLIPGAVAGGLAAHAMAEHKRRYEK